MSHSWELKKLGTSYPESTHLLGLRLWLQGVLMRALCCRSFSSNRCLNTKCLSFWGFPTVGHFLRDTRYSRALSIIPRYYWWSSWGRLGYRPEFIFWSFSNSMIMWNGPIFSWEPALWTLNWQGSCWWWGKKITIAIFGNKQWLLSIKP